MFAFGRKHPLREYLGENSNEPQAKRGRFDNVVLLRERRRGRSVRNRAEDSEASLSTSQRRIIRAGKRKKPLDDEEPNATSAAQGHDPSIATSADENDIISELTKEFKKARLRPVFFTISTFIEQTVGEVGFTMAEECETEVTIRLNFNRMKTGNSAGGLSDAVQESDNGNATLNVFSGNEIVNNSDDNGASQLIDPCIQDPFNFGTQCPLNVGDDDESNPIFKFGVFNESKGNEIVSRNDNFDEKQC